MRPFFKESILFVLVVLMFTPLAFLLMPVVAIIFVVLAMVVLFMGWTSRHDHA